MSKLDFFVEDLKKYMAQTSMIEGYKNHEEVYGWDADEIREWFPTLLKKYGLCDGRITEKCEDCIAYYRCKIVNK